MNASDAYARLSRLELPVLETADVAAALGLSPSAASMTLTRLARSGLVTRLRPGSWLLAREANRYAIANALTAPLGSYVSLQSALYLHGMIEQVPSVVYVVSLGRSQKISTSVATYSVHHIAPELFDGFEERTDGTRLAVPEKALFDVAYFSGSRTRLFSRIPELELPKGFRTSKLRTWISRIGAARRRSMVAERLDAMLEDATTA